MSDAKEFINLTPGPTPVPPSVYAKLSEPVLHHRTEEFGDVYKTVEEGLRCVYRTKNKVLIVTTSGTGGMESSVANVLSPGDKAVVHSTGIFGVRYCKILRNFGIEPVVIEEEWGRAADPGRLREALKEHPGASAVFCQHTDTSTGVVNDIEALAKVVREESEALTVVDAISGLAAEELETDAWDLDVVVSASQKGLMSPPGLAFLSVSEKAWQACEKASLPRFYFDWRTMHERFLMNQTPYTPAVSLFVAQAESLRLIREEGIENVWRRTTELAEYTRGRIQQLGLELFPKDPADNLTAVRLPEGVDGKKLILDIRTKERIAIAGGQQELKGRIVRISHMGFVKKPQIDAGIAALSRHLSLTPA